MSLPLGPLLDALRTVRWPARRTVAAASAGVHTSRLRGSSPELEEYRVYRQGDDPRRIDWRLLARSDRAYVRLTTDRATLPTLVVVDASASMAFPARTLAKWWHAAAVAVGLAAVAQGEGDPVAALVMAGGQARSLGRTTRRSATAELARLLEATQPAGRGEGLAAAVRAARFPRVAVVSDFLGDEADDALLRAARERVAAGGEVVAVHVVAREELAPPDGVLATDPEDPALRRTLARATRAAYDERFAAWRAALARRWRDAGAVYALTTDDEPPARAVRRIVRGDAGGRELEGA